MAANGNETILAEIEREIPHMRRYARGLTRHADRADDLVQDGLERAVKHIDQFTAGTNLRGWLLTILRNAHIDNCRKTRRLSTHDPIEDWADKLVSLPTQESHLQLRRVLKAIQRMRACDRETVRLVAFEAMPFKAVGRRLGIAEGTVKSRLWRARRVLASV